LIVVKRDLTNEGKLPGSESSKGQNASIHPVLKSTELENLEHRCLIRPCNNVGKGKGKRGRKTYAAM